MKNVFLILLLFLSITGCASTQTNTMVSIPPIEPPKEIHVTLKIPYRLIIEVAKQEWSYKILNRTHWVKTGQILEDAVKYFVVPYFDESKEDYITLDVDIIGERRDEMAIVRTSIYKNNLYLYTFVTGSKREDLRTDLSPVRDAIVEAVKQIPQGVSNVLSNPERFIVETRANLNDSAPTTPDFKYFFSAPLITSNLKFFSLAHLSLLAKKSDEALSAAKRAMELSPNSQGAAALLGDIHKNLKNYPQAIENYKKAIALAPNSYAWYARLSQIYELQEDYNELINLWQKAMVANPTWNLSSHFAVAYTKVGKYNDAIVSLNKVIDIRTITGIGTNISIEENFPVVKGVDESGPAKRVGIEVGDKIVKINGQLTKGWDVNKVSQNLRGAEGTQVALTIEKMGEKFEKIITREKMMQKSAAGPLGLRGQVYAVMGNLEQSFKDAEMAYSLDPNDREAKTAMSLAYIQKGKPDEAVKILSNSKDYFNKLLISLAYAKKNEFERAGEVYRDIPEDYLSSKSVFRQDFKKMVLQSMKPYIEGKRKQVRALEAKEQYKEALKEYGDLLRFADEKETKEIRAQVARLLKEKPYLLELPEEARKFAIRAEEYTKEGKFEDAINEYKKALKIVPFHPELYKALALNYGGMKQYSEAIDSMNIYLELYPDAPDVRAAKDEIYRWEAKMEKEGKGI